MKLGLSTLCVTACLLNTVNCVRADSGAPVSRAKSVEKPAVGAKKGNPMDTAPMELRLAFGAGPSLVAELANKSKVPQFYLHDSFHQPSLLALKSADGKTIKPFDSRAIMKRSNALEADMYDSVEPGEVDSLLDESFTASDDGAAWELSWGPFRYEGLLPGKYKVRVTWKCLKDTWSDSEAGTTGRIKGLWKGTLKSQELVFELPSAAP
ncbi:MAG: hypothetical protein M3Y08_07245 [Fibrobacterota bacterium]|nr:hypothetical protein [Fibrobacterota bacterium]